MKAASCIFNLHLADAATQHCSPSFCVLSYLRAPYREGPVPVELKEIPLPWHVFVQLIFQEGTETVHPYRLRIQVARI
ncbi:unnamed protein product [Nezara viridula]|uniref:Uncharacterized protein n=1 Tax=Nezara viridula TaxID=85310 RepID=A0A9P0MTH0_NEZVI|nr:unnamed protein product [Nezara viridula]